MSGEGASVRNAGSSNEAAVEAFRRQWQAAGRGGIDRMVGAAWIVRAAQEIVARIEDLLRPLGLTMTKYECLVVLHASRDGALKLGTMAERLGVHPTSITYAVDQLGRTGLVNRTPHPSDRRQKLATLTDAGRALVEKAMDVIEDGQFGAPGLTDPEWRNLARLLSKAVQVADERIDDHPNSDDPVTVDPVVTNRARRGSGVTQRRRA